MIKIFEEFDSITVVLADLLWVFNDRTHTDALGKSWEDLVSKILMKKQIKFQCCGLMKTDYHGGFSRECKKYHNDVVYGIRYDRDGSVDVMFYNDAILGDNSYHNISNRTPIEICSAIDDKIKDVLIEINAKKFGL